MSPFHPHLSGNSLATFASTFPGSAGTGSVIQPLVPPILDSAGFQSTSSPGSPQLVSSPLGTSNPSYQTQYGGSGDRGFSQSTTGAGGQPATLRSLLETHLPLLFNPQEGQGSGNVLAHALVQGVVLPLETELAWLGACMSGADGWVCIVVGLGKGA